MEKSVIVSEKVHNELMKLKMQEKIKNFDSLINNLIIEYKKQKLNDISKKFKESLDKRGITFDELLKKSRKIREEISDEWYPD